MQEVKLIQLPKIIDDRGNLSFFQNMDHLPFEIQRVYWVYDVPGGEMRGGHAFKQTKELIIALSGSFDVVITKGADKQTFTLNRSYNALYLPEMTWRHLENFSTNALAFVATDRLYEEADYIRDLPIN
jgi:hypothetical protein